MGVEARIAKVAHSGMSEYNNIQQGSASAAPSNTCGILTLSLMCFRRHPHTLRTILLTSAFGCNCVARGVDVQPARAQGAKNFVEALTPHELASAGVDPSSLRPWHVLVLQ